MDKKMYKVSQSTGKVQVWYAYTYQSSVVVHHGQLDGKLQEQRYVAEAKNQGRSNATTAEEQAIVEVEALYEDRYSNKHYRETIEEAEALANDCKEPRKIQNYKDHYNKLPNRCISSIKLNGSRACIIDGQLYSKIGKPEEIKVDLLRKGVERLHELGLADIDCEVYGHGLSLQRIRSAWLKPVRTDKEVCGVANKRFNLKGKDRITSLEEAVDKLGYNPNHDAQRLKLHIFDEPMNSDLGYEKRLLRLVQVEEAVNSEPLLQNCFEFCEWFYTESHEERMEKLTEVCDQDYEGLVHYDPDGEYEFGKRSSNTQKSKPRYDSEALVVGIEKCKNGEGKLKLECCAKLDNVELSAMMKGDRASRMYDVQHQFIGQWVTFDYEELSDKGVPTKAVVRETRLCDSQGNPQE